MEKELNKDFLDGYVDGFKECSEHLSKKLKEAAKQHKSKSLQQKDKEQDDWNWLKYHQNNNYTKKQLVEKLKQKVLEDIDKQIKLNKYHESIIEHIGEIKEIINKRFGF